MAGILVLGDALLDVHATPREPMRPGGDVPADVRLGVGGQGANVAVRLARRGRSVRLACAVGDDVAAPLVRDALYRAGVSVVPMPARATGSVVILLDAAGERTMLSDRVPFASAAAARLPELAPAADWIVVSGYLLEEPRQPLAAAAMGSARRMLVGCPFRDADAWRAGLLALAPDLLVLNRREAASLVDLPPDRSPAELATTLAPLTEGTTVVVTDGAGVAAATGTDPAIETATPAGDGVIDTTGAGDAFAATLLAEVHAAWPPSAEALRAAMVRAGTVASQVARVVGAQTPVPAEETA
ncbi:MAG TPA: PfkB family carbohydrate kinase [Candidatus Limnocylindria bacterium]|nr:PfkB family carbohydrate kinase [Candidatus Limnocylindria bacterium]